MMNQLPPTPSKDNTCCVIVTYHPDDNFVSRVMAIRDQVGKVLIVDNDSGSQAVSTLQKLSAELDVELILNEKNLGVGAALNQGLEWAKKEQLHWLLALDQDSTVYDSIIEGLAEAYKACEEKDKVALIGSNYMDRAVDAPFYQGGDAYSAPYVETDSIITSGSLTSIDAATRIGRFREDFFIDLVDFEYCLRARSLGYKVIMTTNTLMEHCVAAPDKHRLLWKKLVTPNAPAFRRYYRARNHVVVTRAYWATERQVLKATIIQHLKELVLLWLFEKDKLWKSRMVLRGIVDGFRGKMGPLG